MAPAPSVTAAANHAARPPSARRRSARAPAESPANTPGTPADAGPSFAGPPAAAPAAWADGARISHPHPVAELCELGLADAVALAQLVDRVEPAMSGPPLDDALRQDRSDARQ